MTSSTSKLLNEDSVSLGEVAGLNLPVIDLLEAVELEVKSAGRGNLVLGYGEDLRGVRVAEKQWQQWKTADGNTGSGMRNGSVVNSSSGSEGRHVRQVGHRGHGFRRGRYRTSRPACRFGHGHLASPQQGPPSQSADHLDLGIPVASLASIVEAMRSSAMWLIRQSYLASAKREKAR